MSAARRPHISAPADLRGRRRWGTSPFRGVYQVPSGRWEAKLRVNLRTYRGGTHDTPEAAARAFDRLALLHLGGETPLNFPDEAPADVPEPDAATVVVTEVAAKPVRRRVPYNHHGLDRDDDAEIRRNIEAIRKTKVDAPREWTVPRMRDRGMLDG